MAAEEREAIFTIATGRRGVGKSYTTLKMIERYIQNKIAADGGFIEARKFLIYDINGEYTPEELRKNGFNFTIPILHINDLQKWTNQKTVEVRRILPLDADNSMTRSTNIMIATLDRILSTFRGGAVLLEDISGYLDGSSVSQEIFSSITRNRHIDLDIMVHLQSLSPIPTKFWQNVNMIRLHKQNDNIYRYLQRTNSPELFAIATTLVDMQYKKNPRFYCFADMYDNKIYGAFSAEDYQLAVLDYLQANPSEVRRAMQRYSGKKEEARLCATADLLNRYMEFYVDKSTKALPSIAIKPVLPTYVQPLQIQQGR